MRKFTMLCTLICLSLLSFSQSGEEENVVKAIKAKTDAYERRDLQAWKASWQHDAKVSNVFISKDGYFIIKGWDSLSVFMDREIMQNPKPDTTAHSSFENFSVHADGNLATAEYNVNIAPVKDESALFPYIGAQHFHVYEVFVKENGQWKTNTRIRSLPESYDINEHTPEVDLNTAGYDLLAAKKINEAIEIFKLNVKLHPDSWNVYDSLGEAYAAAGNKKDAIANYEKSIQLNPNNSSGKETLTKLKQK